MLEEYAFHNTKKLPQPEIVFFANNRWFLEVPPRFELGDEGFADPGLTAWLWHHIQLSRHLQRLSCNNALKDISAAHFILQGKRGFVKYEKVGNISISLSLNNRSILDDFNFTLNRGDKAVIIGEEGNGKSTLIKLIYDENLLDDYCNYGY